MPLSLCYWILYLLAVLMGGYLAWGPNPPSRLWGGYPLLLLLLLLVIGLRIFGSPLHAG